MHLNRELLIVGDRAVLEVLVRRHELGDQLLALDPCVQRARLAQAADDSELLERTLVDVAVSAIQTIARIRASRPRLVTTEER